MLIIHWLIIYLIKTCYKIDKCVLHEFVNIYENYNDNKTYELLFLISYIYHNISFILSYYG